MFRTVNKSVFLSIVLVVVMLAAVSPVPGQVSDTPDPRFPLLAIGKAGPDAVNLQVWTNRKQGEAYKAGDRVLIHFKVDKKAYVTAINVSAKGDVTVLFPNQEQRDNLIIPGREYTLFGDDSKLRLVLGKGLPEARIGFYVSGEPFELDPLRIPANQPVLKIGAEAKENVAILKKKLEHLAKTQGFNRAYLAVKSGPDESTDLKLMGTPGSQKGIGIQKLPTGQSETPESVTGTQGLKSDVPEPVTGTQGLK